MDKDFGVPALVSSVLFVLIVASAIADYRNADRSINLPNSTDCSPRVFPADYANPKMTHLGQLR